ncbi:MAG: hypothetical protein R2771_08700 [Saprospiraceae bacterium]
MLFTIIFSTYSCKEQNTDSNDKTISTVNFEEVHDSIAYGMLVRNCYICHMPQNPNQVLAPPLFRVKEHYLPIYKEKSEFINAIVDWAQSPTIEKSVMPGAVRQFNCMPSLNYVPIDTLQQIAAYIFRNEMEKPEFFDEMHVVNNMGQGNNRFNNKQSDSLNTKVTVDNEVKLAIQNASNLLNNFKGNNISDYQQLGRDFFHLTKEILLNKNNDGDTWKQLHIFFNNMESDMHSLMTVESTTEGNNLKNNLIDKIKMFSNKFQ